MSAVSPEKVSPEGAARADSPSPRWSTRLSRSSTVPVSASTKLMKACGSPEPSSSAWSGCSRVVSHARRTPSFGVGTAIRRARWTSRLPAAANVCQGPVVSVGVRSPRSRSTSRAAAAIAAGASSLRVPETVSSPVTDEEIQPIRPSRATPTLSSPSWPAERSPKVWRNVTTWATSRLRTGLPSRDRVRSGESKRGESPTTSRSATALGEKRNRSRCARTKALATSTAGPDRGAER